MHMCTSAALAVQKIPCGTAVKGGREVKGFCRHGPWMTMKPLLLEGVVLASGELRRSSLHSLAVPNFLTECSTGVFILYDVHP